MKNINFPSPQRMVGCCGLSPASALSVVTGEKFMPFNIPSARTDVFNRKSCVSS